MVINISKALWTGTKVMWFVLGVLVLSVTLYAFDGKPNSDIWIFLTWSMLVLSFPASFMVSLVHMILGKAFAITIETTYVSLTLEWSLYYALGYFQWFKLMPYIIDKFRSLKES